LGFEVTPFNMHCSNQQQNLTRDHPLKWSFTDMSDSSPVMASDDLSLQESSKGIKPRGFLSTLFFFLNDDQIVCFEVLIM
jgi:hypothetical protein